MKMISIMGNLIVILMIAPVCNLWGFEIVSPPQYTEVHPGDTVLIEVQLSPGEIVSGIYFDTFSQKITGPPYAYQYKIGPNQLGDIEIAIIAVKPESEGPFLTADDAISSVADLHLKSTLPSTIKIKSLRAKYTREKISFYLNKDKSTGSYIPDTGRLRVYAMYSDGVERSASSASTGTTYSSSNEKILTVNADGLMTALSPGTVRITVRNGDKKIVMDATVLSK